MEPEHEDWWYETAEVEHQGAADDADASFNDVKLFLAEHTNGAEAAPGPSYAVLDSGCGRSVVGEETLRQLRTIWIPIHETNSFRYGNGQQEASTQVVEMPVQLAHRRGCGPGGSACRSGASFDEPSSHRGHGLCQGRALHHGGSRPVRGARRRVHRPRFSRTGAR